MIEQELRKLGKTDLYKLIIEISEENGRLKKENADLNKQLEEKRINIEKYGSIAEACAGINKLFESADKSAAQFIDNASAIESEAKVKSEQLIEETQKKCDLMIKDAENKVSDARVQCAAMIAAAKKGVDEQWEELKKRLDKYCEVHEGLKEKLESLNIKLI